MCTVTIGTVELGDFPLLLAPMEEVSDPPFRAVCKEQGADLVYTEFISSEGLIRDAEKSIKKLDIYDYERPVGIQIFGDLFWIPAIFFRQNAILSQTRYRRFKQHIV